VPVVAYAEVVGRWFFVMMTDTEALWFASFGLGSVGLFIGAYWPRIKRLFASLPDLTEYRLRLPYERRAPHRAPETRATETAAPIKAPSTAPTVKPPPQLLLKSYKSKIDREKLDAALLELFQVLNSDAVAARRNAEYNLIHNWETRFVNDGRDVFLGLIDSVRADVLTAVTHINRVTYGTEYAYYLDELQDALREDQSSNLLGPLDALKSIAAAVPEKLSLEQLRILMSSQHAAFEKAVKDNGNWLGDALQRVRLKRQALESEA